jgi:hypothetical protein
MKSDFDWHAAPLTGDTIVTANYRTTQNMRRFMRAKIPGFTFSRDFMAWIRANEGITLDDVVAEAKRRAAEK